MVLWQQHLATCRALGGKRGIAWSLAELGILVSRTGDFATAEELLAESVNLHRAIQNVTGEAYALVIASCTATRSGRYDLALTRLRESAGLLRQARRADDPIRCLEALGELALARDKTEVGAHCYTVATGARARLGIRGLRSNRRP